MITKRKKLNPANALDLLSAWDFADDAMANESDTIAVAIIITAARGVDTAVKANMPMSARLRIDVVSAIHASGLAFPVLTGAGEAPAPRISCPLEGTADVTGGKLVVDGTNDDGGVPEAEERTSPPIPGVD